MGHTRLIIRGPNAGFQPELNGTKALVYNGEIYNVDELEAVLEKKGYSSDTDLLSDLLAKFGVNILAKLKGEFSLAFFDHEKIFLARDRLGVKPLYYYNTGKVLFFASEIKALVNCLEEKPELYALKLDSYVKPFGDYTPIKQIKQVLPGHFIEFKLDCGKILEKQIAYANAQDNVSISSLETAKEKIKKTLDGVVESMMASDTRVGLLLSGGLDSTILASIVLEHSNKTVPAFCVGSQESNEFDDAQIVADEFGINLKLIEISENYILKNAEKAVKNLETYDAGPLPTAIAMDKLFSKINTKVVLSGEGPDELFGGYEEVFSIFRETNPNYPLFHRQIIEATRCMYQRQLARLDKMSLAHSVEARVPFLHADFVDLALSIDSRFKYKIGREKTVLFEAFKKILPASIRKKHKQRFGIAAGTKKILERNFGNLQDFAKQKFLQAYSIQDKKVI